MQDLSLHILDVAENGVTAGANLIEISIIEDIPHDSLTVIIQDNGRGMSKTFLSKALDPFVTTRTTRKIGLGLSLFQQAAQTAEGELGIESEEGRGTRVTATMRHSHLDRKPLGDVGETIVTLINGNPDVDFVFTHTVNRLTYSLDTRELRSQLGEVPINHPQVVALIRENLISGLKEIGVE
jgi:nitrogen fixation/metabolism regulation signal transduction histidine kinase